MTTAKGSNLNIDDKIASSYYLGIGSGRISDQKFRNFDYDSFVHGLMILNLHSIAIIN